MGSRAYVREGRGEGEMFVIRKETDRAGVRREKWD